MDGTHISLAIKDVISSLDLPWLERLPWLDQHIRVRVKVVLVQVVCSTGMGTGGAKGNTGVNTSPMHTRTNTHTYTNTYTRPSSLSRSGQTLEASELGEVL